MIPSLELEAPPKKVEGVTHVAELPYTVALCGAQLGGRFADGEEIECVVCADLDRKAVAMTDDGGTEARA